MITANAFQSDIFSMTSLTAAINAIPFQPTGIQQLGIYNSDGISTLDAFVEVANDTLSLYSVRPRGAPGQPLIDEKRTGYSFRAPHIPAAEAIYADEVIGVRNFGGIETETVEAKRTGVITRMRMYMDYTLEYHRMLNIASGVFLDSNNTQVSLFTTFGLAQQSFDADLDDASQNIIGDCGTYLEAIESALGAVPFTGVVALCGSSFWSAFRGHVKVRETFLNTAMAPEMRSDPRQPLEFGGITWMRYVGNTSVLIPTAEARLLPTGVPDMYITRYAPANYIETVNTMGLPFYAKAEPMEFGKGILIEAQSNPLNLITRPRAVVRLYT